MIRPFPFRATAAVIAAAAIAVLTGCTAAPSTAPDAGTTAVPASAQRFVCPARAEVAGLTAIPFSESASSATSCTYGSPVATVTVRHPAGSGATLSALRYAATGRGVTTTDAPGIAFDAFTATTKRGCTVWFSAADGVASSVEARRSGVSGARACVVATAVATLAGSATPRTAAPTVAVLAPRTLLGTTTVDQRWPWRIAQDAVVRIDRLTGSGYLHPSSASSFAEVAASVPTDSAAVVFVSGSAEAGTPTLALLRGATRALSAAATRAPDARLIVVGPAADGSVPAADLASLRVDLQAVAKIAGATYVDPATSGAAGVTPSTALAGVADGVTKALRAGVTAD